jgi:hypothetical protein
MVSFHPREWQSRGWPVSRETPLIIASRSSPIFALDIPFLPAWRRITIAG